MEEESEVMGEGELISFGLIAASGEARSEAFEALKAAREGDFAHAHELIDQSKKTFLEAHNQQTELLTREAQGNHVEVDVLLVHAQDHLMTSMLAQELIADFINLYETKQDKNA